MSGVASAVAPSHPRRPGRIAAALVVVVGLLAGPSGALAADPQPTLAPDRTTSSEPLDPVDDQVLVRYREGTSAARRLDIRRAHDLARVPGASTATTDVVRAGGRSTATIRRLLADDPAVVAVATNHRRELAVDPVDEPGFGSLWALHNRGQRLDGTVFQTGIADVDLDGLEALRLGLGSPSIVVAVVDDGVDIDHPDLAGAIWTNPGEAGAKATNGIDDDGNGYRDDVHGWDFCNDDNTVHDDGEDGHGTHVAGTIAASLDGEGIVGVAPGVKIMPLKFIDESRFCGSDDMAVAAIDYAASFGVPIINASWGGSSPSVVLDAAIADSGALLVAAAGNDGVDIDQPGGPRFYPASSTLPNILAVAAIDQRGRLATFSDYGRKSVDLGAPGVNIVSAYPSFTGCPAPCYVWMAGTSMAAPHVSGVAALVASRSAGLRDDELLLRSRLLASGTNLSALSGKTTTGRLVNAWRAVDAAGPAVLPADRFAVPTGAIVGSSSVALRVSWPTATDALSAVSSYGLKKKVGATWSTVTTGTTGTSIRTPVPYGTGTTFRLTARDAPGNTSPGKDSPVLTTTLYGDASSRITYGGGWSTASSASALGDRLHTARRAGAWATFSFTGRSVAIVAPRSSSRGTFRVYIDGVLRTTVDLRSSSVQSRRAVYSIGWTSSGPHTVRIVAATGRRIDLDGFVVVR
jgi:subtilisin family serine protease